jgi:hypothetical protein
MQTKWVVPLVHEHSLPNKLRHRLSAHHPHPRHSRLPIRIPYCDIVLRTRYLAAKSRNIRPPWENRGAIAQAPLLLLGTRMPFSNHVLTLLLRRQELIAWLNNLLQLNITKVEQCGTGYVMTLAAAERAGLAAKGRRC